MTSVAEHNASRGDYERRRMDQLRALQATVPAELSKRSWTLTAFAEERTRRLQALVAHAKARSPWHAERLEGVAPEEVTEATIAELPVMTKSDLMEHWDHIVCDRRLTLAIAEEAIDRARHGEPGYLFDEHQAFASGGSSGTRGVFVWDFEGLVRGVAIAARFHQWVNAEVGPEPPARTAYVQATNPGHASNLIARCFGDPTLPTMHLSPDQAPSELVDALNRFQPTKLVGYPSVLHSLAEEALGGRLRIDVQRIQCQAEPLLPETRVLLQEAFGAVTTELYGASECLNLAQGWPGEELLRLAEDNAVLEPLTASGVATAPDEPSSKLLLTNVTNFVLPLIRYELNDELTWVTAADPGRPGRGVRVAGRCDDCFAWGNSTLHPHVLRSILGRREIGEYQVRQTPDGVDITVRAAHELDFAAVLSAVQDALVLAGVRRAVVTVRRVDAIARHEATGKLKRFVPLQ